MVMKDKLEKTYHKGGYYFIKKVSIIFLAVMTGAFIIAIPTYISQVSMRKQTAGIAQETTSSEVTSDSEGNEDYEDYNI